MPLLCPLKSLFRRAAAAAVAAVTLGVAAPASATFVVGQWDPVFDTMNFSNLGWRGTTTTFVTASCLSLGPGIGFVANSLTCPMSVISATVEFYDFNDPPVPATAETLNFTGMTVSGIYLDLVTGDLDGVILSVSTPVPSTSALAFYGVAQASFALEQVYSVGDDATYAQLYWTGLDKNEMPAGGMNVNPARVRFSLRTVPEPASLLLAGAALLLAGLVRRRRNGR